MEIVIPSVEFLIAGYVAGLLAGVATVAVLRTAFRVGSAGNWFLLAVLLPLPILAAVPLTSIVFLPTEAALPSVGMTIVVGFFVIHWLFPALLPDFQTDSFSASAFLALILGLVLMAVGLVMGEFPEGLITDPMDPFATTGPGLDEFDMPD